MSLAAFLPSPPASIPLLPNSRREPILQATVSVLPSPSPEILRQQVTAAAHTVVVKVGTRVLTQADGTLNHERIEQLAEEIHAISAGGRRVVLVSSGAVGAGISLLGLKARPTDLAKLQAVAAVGQTHLIQTYDRTFAKHGRRAAQVLLTIEDVDDRIRYLNVRNTLHSLLEFGAVPIINENDTVSVDELKTTFGDNDRLAAMVTNLLRAPLLDRALRHRRALRRRSAPRHARSSSRPSSGSTSACWPTSATARRASAKAAWPASSKRPASSPPPART